jgi:hypothetical protein
MHAPWWFRPRKLQWGLVDDYSRHHRTEASRLVIAYNEDHALQPGREIWGRACGRCACGSSGGKYCADMGEFGDGVVTSCIAVAAGQILC